jgi:hypothetical protein
MLPVCVPLCDEVLKCDCDFVLCLCAGRFYLYKSVNRSLVVMPK